MNLKLERIKKNKSQAQLEEVSGVSRITISKIEKGNIQNVRVGILEKLATALGIPVKQFFEE